MVLRTRAHHVGCLLLAVSVGQVLVLCRLPWCVDHANADSRCIVFDWVFVLDLLRPLIAPLYDHHRQVQLLLPLRVLLVLFPGGVIIAPQIQVRVLEDGIIRRLDILRLLVSLLPLLRLAGSGVLVQLCGVVGVAWEGINDFVCSLDKAFDLGDLGGEGLGLLAVEGDSMII